VAPPLNFWKEKNYRGLRLYRINNRFVGAGSERICVGAGSERICVGAGSEPAPTTCDKIKIWGKNNMRKFVIAGNWKMHKTNAEAVELAEALIGKTALIEKTQMIVCPPATALTTVCSVVKDSKIAVGAQNMYWESQGAFTGEISSEMIKSTGATYVILGHSERRQFFGETDETVNKKTLHALNSQLNPIVCIGESLEERENGITKDVINDQLDGALSGISADQMAKIILAYEPIWAIGTGKTATPDQAQDVHAFIRSKLASMYDAETSDNIIIQYGGSVKPGNAAELLNQPDIDGALVGGACLEAESFSEIIKAAESLS
jgi:triosephosphate isomerase